MFGGEQPSTRKTTISFSPTTNTAYPERKGDNEHRCAIMRTQKPYTLLRNSRKFKQGHHLESALRQSITTPRRYSFHRVKSSAPSTIRKNIPIPSLQLMRPAYGIQHRLSGFQSKVVGIIQTELTARLAELVVRQTLQGGLGRDGHEDREGDIAMGEAEGTGACFCCLGIDSSQYTMLLST